MDALEEFKNGVKEQLAALRVMLTTADSPVKQVRAMAIFQTDDRQLHIVFIPDESDNSLVAKILLHFNTQFGATRLYLLSEAWVISRDKPPLTSDRPPRECEDRREVLLCFAVDRYAGMVRADQEIHRNPDGSPFFTGEPYVCVVPEHAIPSSFPTKSQLWPNAQDSAIRIN